MSWPIFTKEVMSQFVMCVFQSQCLLHPQSPAVQGPEDPGSTTQGKGICHFVQKPIIALVCGLRLHCLNAICTQPHKASGVVWLLRWQKYELVNISLVNALGNEQYRAIKVNGNFRIY